MVYVSQLPKLYNDQNWEIFRDQLEIFFEVNKVPTHKKQQLLLFALSEDAYATICDICHPTKPSTKTYDAIVELFQRHYVPKSTKYHRRKQFYAAVQLKNESIKDWMFRITDLSMLCKFGDKFEAILLDKFVCGLKSPAILDRICNEPNDVTSLQRAFEIAVNAEQPKKNQHC